MKKSRFTEEQIIAILREQEAGVATAEVCRKHGVSSHKWKAKFGGLDVSEARRLKDENGRLKRMLADAMLDNAALKDLLEKKVYCEEKLMVRRRGGRKRAVGTRRPIETPVAANERWSLDLPHPTSSRTGAASASSPWSTTARGNAWRSRPTRRCPACGSPASSTTSCAGADDRR
jgi:putative transposase